MVVIEVSSRLPTACGEDNPGLLLVDKKDIVYIICAMRQRLYGTVIDVQKVQLPPAVFLRYQQDLTQFPDNFGPVAINVRGARFAIYFVRISPIEIIPV